jgi:hypothetical protein
MITTLERIIKSRADRNLRELTVAEQSEILTTGFYDEEKYEEPPK